jgi:hypothetical protein
MQLFLRLVLTLLLTILECVQVGILVGSIYGSIQTGKWVIVHWLDGTFSFLLTAGLWAAWLCGSFLTSFFSGLAVRWPLRRLLQAGAWMWLGVFLAAAVYAWCFPPYSAGLVAARVLWSLLCICFGLWAFLVVSFMAQTQRGVK